MVGRGILGDKTKGGFYQMRKGEGGQKDLWTLDVATLEYRPQQKAKLPAFDAAKNIEDTRARMKSLFWGKDRVAEFLWKTSSRVFTYAANRIPEIADTVVEVDRAMKWGFGWELGVFEAWDAVGVEKVAAKLKEEGRAVPQNVATDARRGRDLLLQDGGRAGVLLRLCLGRVQARGRDAGRRRAQVCERPHGRHQEERGRVAHRPRRRRGVS